MEHSSELGGPSGAPVVKRSRVTPLTGLPRWAQVTVVVVIAAVVGVAALCQAGVLAPQFNVVGSGSGAGGPVAPEWAATAPEIVGSALRSEQTHWVVLENQSWRTWSVNALVLDEEDVHGPFEVAAFLGPADEPIRPPEARATWPEFGPRPLAVPPGGHLYLVVTDMRACAHPSGPTPSDRLQAAVGIATPLGQRWLRPSLFVPPNCRR